MNIEIKKLHGDAKIPVYQTQGSAGADLHAYLPETIIIKPCDIAIIPTGLSVAIPTGFEMQIRSRSGLASKKIIVANSPGTIDADYRGEIKILLLNLSNNDFQVTHNMRIAQAIFAPIVQGNFITVDQLLETKRGMGGFGSTGLEH